MQLVLPSAQNYVIITSTAVVHRYEFNVSLPVEWRRVIEHIVNDELMKWVAVTLFVWCKQDR